MRVALDHWPAVSHAPGVGRYSRELARALAGLADRPEVLLAEIGPGTRPEARRLAGLGDLRRLERVVSERRIALPRLLGGAGVERFLPPFDLFHRTRSLLPALGRVPSVLPVFELPAAATPAARTLAKVARSSAAVLVFAEALRRPCADLLSLPSERIFMSPVGCEHFERDRQTDPRPCPRRRLLVLGKVRAERRPATLVQAVTGLRRQGLDLELLWIGRRGDGARELEQALAAEPAAQWLASPDEDSLPLFLAEADLLVHVAPAEGTPVTPLEAFSAGTGVLALRSPLLEEALTDLAFWVRDPGDARSLAEDIAQALARSGEGAAREQRRAHASRFSWQACAEATVRIWRSAALPAEGLLHSGPAE